MIRYEKLKICVVNQYQLLGGNILFLLLARLFQVEGALATYSEEVVQSPGTGSVRGAAHELLEFIGYGEETSVILRNIKECFGQGASKAKFQKEFFLVEQSKSESINQFAGRVEQHFKQLHALYPGQYDCSQLKKCIFQGMHPHLRDSMQFLYMKEDLGYKEFLAAVYEAEMEGSEGKIVSTKANALTVEKVSENNDHIEFKDLKQQIVICNDNEGCQSWKYKT